MIWLLVGYMWLFIHRPFEVWPWLGELRVERGYMLATILYWAIAVDKQWVRNRLNVAFACFWLVMLAAWITSPYAARGTHTVESYFKIAVFYVLVITSVRTERDLKLLIIMFLGAMSLYMAHSFREYLCGRHVYRMGTARMVGVDRTYNDPNTFGATLLYALPMVLPAWTLVKNHWQRGLLLGYVGLACGCILLTGSRSAFVGLCFLCLMAAMLSKYRLMVLAGLVVAAPLVWFSLSADLQNRYLTLINPSYGPASAQQSAEGRTKGWHDGVRLWKEHPMLGVGPGVFGIATGSGMQSHHLYGQVLGELGTLGAVALGLVVLGFFANYLAMRRVCREEPGFAGSFPARLIQAVTMTVVLLLLMGLGGHNLYRYTWMWFGAFQAIALCCLMTRTEQLADEALPVVADGSESALEEYGFV